MLSNSEQAALAVFRSFKVSPGEMLCFHGPQLDKHSATLRVLTEKNLIVKEQFAGGYSLTRAGYDALSERSQPPAASPVKSGVKTLAAKPSPAKPAASAAAPVRAAVRTAAARPSTRVAAPKAAAHSPAAHSAAKKPSAPSQPTKRR
ncbi:MAG TPA: hypothetical protein VEQ85_03335 [Lacipirellulaceae bacterium]|nr:hypothetical protein [Lacipirellulaceae bacterium]